MDRVRCSFCKGHNCSFKGSSDKKGFYLENFSCRDCGHKSTDNKIYLFDLGRWG